MHDVVRVFCAESREHHVAFIRFAVTVGIFEVQQFGTCSNISTAISGGDASWNQKSIREHLRLITHSIAILIMQNQHTIICFCTRFNLRIGR